MHDEEKEKRKIFLERNGNCLRPRASFHDTHTITERTHEKAPEKTDVSTATLRGWLCQPEFFAAYQTSYPPQRAASTLKAMNSAIHSSSRRESPNTKSVMSVHCAIDLNKSSRAR
jgi:hypothetical protein